MKYITLLLLFIFFVSCSKDKKETPMANEEKPGNITIVSDNSVGVDNVSPFMGYNVTGEYMVKYSPDGEETPVTKEIGAHVVIRNHPYESIHKSLLKKKLSKNFIVKCSACHDDYGNGVIGPSLLTKTSDEIFDMIKKYQSGKSKNVLMSELISKMDDKEIRFLADDIAKFNEDVRKEQGK